MREARFLRRHWPKVIVALLLTFASGLVDIVGYLGVFHLFTAHLTGATVQLGHSLITRNWVDIFAAIAIVMSFVGGSILGRTIIEIGARSRIRSIGSMTLAIEAVLLMSLVYAHSWFAARPYLGLAMLAGAMGVQTATLTGVGPLTVHTTFVTGMLNKIGQLIPRMAFRAYDLFRSNSPSQRDAQNEDVQLTVFLFCIWLFYIVGAVMGTWSYGSWGLRALDVAIGVLAVDVAIDQFRPLSIDEEKEQSER